MYKITHNIQTIVYGLSLINKVSNPINSKLSSFSGVQEAGFVFPIRTIGKIPNEYLASINDSLNLLPDKVVNTINKNMYEIVVVDDICKATKKFNIQTSKEAMPLAFTYSKGNDNIICFSNNIPSSLRKPAVFHEVGHSLDYIFNLSKQNEIKEAVSKDLKLIIKDRKLDSLSKNERERLNIYFMCNDVNSAVGEIVADLFAWQQNSGCYGTIYTTGKNNPNLMQNLFQNTNKALEILLARLI